ncbi:MAG: hypothetical protein AB8B91_21645 [Rubripirellula sp.]
MADITEEKFLQIYGDLLVQYWGLPAHKERFKADPLAVLKEFGLDPGSANVNVKYIAAGDNSPQENNLNIPDPSASSAFQLWVKGKEMGDIDFFVPEEPPEDSNSMELSDEELMAVAGGWSISCCSCSPCCCC